MVLSKKLGLLSVGLVLSGCMSNTPAATVNGTTITSSALLSEVNSIVANKAFVKQLQASQKIYGQGSDSYDMGFVDEVLNRRISMDLLNQKAHSLKISLSAQDIALGRIDAEQTFGGATVFDQFSKSYQAQLIKDAAVLDGVEARLVNANISLEALKSYYGANAAQFASICSSQILVGTQAQADSIYAQLQHGGNFAALAKANSGDTNTAANGGAVGCGTYSNYVTSLGSQYAQIIKSLAPNSVAPPAHLPTGWSIIEVTSRTTAPFDQLTPQIRAAILGTKGQSAITNFLNSATKAAKISINSKYGHLAVTSNGIGVAPPTAPSSSKLNFFVPPIG